MFRSWSYHSRLPRCSNSQERPTQWIEGKSQIKWLWAADPGRGQGREGQDGSRHTFRAAAMSTLSSISKGQIAKAGWKSCSFSRHLMRTAS